MTIVVIAALAVPAAGQPVGPPEDDWHRPLEAPGEAITQAGDLTVVAEATGLVALDEDGATAWAVPVTGELGLTTVSGAADGSSYVLGVAHDDGTIGGQPVDGPVDEFPGSPFVAHVTEAGTVDAVLPMSDYWTISDLVAMPDGSGFAVVGGAFLGSGGYWIGRYDAAGAALWSTEVHGDLPPALQTPTGMDIDVDDAGDIAVWGEHGGELVVGEGASAVSVTATPNDVTGRSEGETFVALVGPDGTPSWAHSLGSVDRVDAGDAGLDAVGDLIAVVTTTFRLHVDGVPVEPAQPGGIVAVRFDADGDLDWSREVVGALYDPTLDVEADGTVHLGGRAPADLTVGDLGDRVTTVEGAAQDFAQPGVGLVGLDPDGTPRYARVLRSSLECCGSEYRGGRVDVLATATGLRLLVIGAVDLTPGDDAGPPTASGSTVVGLGLAGPEPAEAPNVGPELVWFRAVGSPTGPGVGLLDHWGGAMAIAGETPQYEDGTIDTLEGTVPLPELDDFVGRLAGNGTVQWVRRVTTVLSGDVPDPDVRDVAVDRVGGVYLTGSMHGDLVLTGPGGVVARTYRRPAGTHVNSLHGFVARYGPGGELAWLRILREAVVGQTADAIGQQVSALPDGGVLVALSSSGAIRYGPRARDTIVQPAGGGRVLLVRYDRNGNPVWARAARGQAWTVDSDQRGRAVEAGTFTSHQFPAGDDTLTIDDGDAGLYLTRRDADGRRVSGLLLASGPFDPDGIPWLVDQLAVDADGRAWVAVTFYEDAELLPGRPGATPVAADTTVLFQVGAANRVRHLLPVHGRVSSESVDADGAYRLWTLAGSGPVQVGDEDLTLGTHDLLLLSVTTDGDVRATVDGQGGSELVRAIGRPDGDVVAVGTPRVAHFGANTDSEVHVHEEGPGRISILRYRDVLY